MASKSCRWLSTTAACFGLLTLAGAGWGQELAPTADPATTESEGPAASGDSPEQARQALRRGDEERRAGRLEEAILAYQEAAGLLRTLASENSGVRTKAGIAIGRLAATYWEAKRLLEAVEAYEEAVGIFRELAADDPDAYNGYVVYALDRIAIGYTILGRLDDAVTVHLEAVELERELARKDPSLRAPLAAMLNRLGILYAQSGRKNDSVIVREEAVEILRALNVDQPRRADRADLGVSLSQLASAYGLLGREEEARRALKEALAVLAVGYEDDPQRYGAPLAQAKHLMGRLWRQDGELDKSVSAFLEAATLLREVDAEVLYLVRAPFYAVLNDLATTVDGTERWKEAEEAYEISIPVFKARYEDDPARWGDFLITILFSLARLQQRNGDCPAALQSVLEARQIDGWRERSDLLAQVELACFGGPALR